MYENDEREIIEILDSIPDKYRVIENHIKTDMINEYYELLEKVDIENSELQFESLIVLNDSKSFTELKKILVLLSEIGDVKSYRRIEEIIKLEKNEIVEFAYVALKFARLNLENQLSDEPIGFISSGLSGKENKLRYYFAVKSEDEIDENKEAIIVDELQQICRTCDSEFEEIENHHEFVLIRILVSIDFAIGNVIDQLISKCPFIDAEYLCTNVEKPTPEFVNKWVNGEIE